MDPTLHAWEMVSHPSAGAPFFHRAEPVPVPALSRSLFFFEDAGFADSGGGPAGRAAARAPTRLTGRQVRRVLLAARGLARRARS
jgi:hypothetical protein